MAGEQCAVNEARNGFVKMVAPSLVVLAGLLVLASWAQVRMGLAPLGALRRQLEILRAGRGERLTGHVPSNSGLASDLNALMESQSQAIERTRANAAKLAHGLKTPLAVLSTEARALRERGETSAADSMDHEIGMMNVHVMRTLAAARAVGPRRRCRPHAGTLADPAGRRDEASAARRRTQWEVKRAGKFGISVDPRDMEEMPATCWTTPANGRATG